MELYDIGFENKSASECIFLDWSVLTSWLIEMFWTDILSITTWVKGILWGLLYLSNDLCFFFYCWAKYLLDLTDYRLFSIGAGPIEEKDR